MTGEENSASVMLDLDLLYAVSRCETEDGLRQIAEQFCDRNEFSRFIYGLAGPDIVLTNYPNDWLDNYVQNRWHRGKDPVINAINQRRRSVAWDLQSLRTCTPRLDAEQQRILAERWDVGVRAGVTAPVYDQPGSPFDYAIVSFSRETPLSERERQFREPIVQLFAAYFQSAAVQVLRPTKANAEPSDTKLTPREIECLSWAAKGKPSWEIGQGLAISTATVKFHLANAATKLNARGRASAVARAIKLGLISP